MSYEILPYRPEFRTGVIALQKHLVSPNPELNDAYFNWKHESNPYTREPLVYVAVAKGEVAGMRAFLGARWRLPGGDATAFWPCACDFVIDPAHRGQRLFRQIMDVALVDLAAKGIGPFLNWSASPVTYGASVRTGWRLAGSYALMGRQTSHGRRARRWAERLRRVPFAWRFADRSLALALRSGFDAFDAAWSGRATDAGFEIGRQPRPEEMAELARAAASARVGHERDATYYGWRFHNPMSDYRFLHWNRSGERGFLVLHARRRGAGADLSCVDWAVSTPLLFATMLSKVVEVGGYDSLTLWSATLDAASIAQLTELEFAPIDQTRGDPAYRPGLLVLDARGSGLVVDNPIAATNLAGIDRWDLRMIYSDFY